MEISVVATLVVGESSLFYKIKYKAEDMVFFKKCESYLIIYRCYSYEDFNTNEALKKLKSLSESEIREMIINKVKASFQSRMRKKNNNAEFNQLVKKMGKLEFKIKVED